MAFTQKIIYFTYSRKIGIVISQSIAKIGPLNKLGILTFLIAEFIGKMKSHLEDWKKFEQFKPIMKYDSATQYSPKRSMTGENQDLLSQIDRVYNLSWFHSLL